MALLWQKRLENGRADSDSFLTAKNLQEDVIEGLSIGGDDYITKPFSMEVLLCDKP